MRNLILPALILLAASQAYAGADTGFMPYNPSLPVGGPGPFLNITQSGEAMTNAMAHIGWSLAIPLLGEHIGGTKGKWIAGFTWIAFTIVQESLFHAPKGYGSTYPSEVRTDLITRIVPTLLVLSF